MIALGRGTANGKTYNLINWGLIPSYLNEDALESDVDTESNLALPPPNGDFESFLFSNLPAIQGIFSGSEFFYKGGANNRLQLNSDPPKALWPNILETAKVLHAFKSEIGKPVTLNSVYRNRAYNEGIGGAKNSLHKQFNAVDLRVSDPSTGPTDWFNILNNMRKQGMFKGGLSKYKTSVHLDTRGVNSDW